MIGRNLGDFGHESLKRPPLLAEQSAFPAPSSGTEVREFDHLALRCRNNDKRKGLTSQRLLFRSELPMKLAKLIVSQKHASSVRASPYARKAAGLSLKGLEVLPDDSKDWRRVGKSLGKMRLYRDLPSSATAVAAA